MMIKRLLKRLPIYNIYCILKNKKYLKKRNIAIHSNGIKKIEMLSKHISTMIFVDYGTLLGVIRDKKIIEWDDDIDLGIIINDLFTWNNLEEIMYSFGFKKKHEFVYNNEITEQNYEKDYVSMDFFRHYEANAYSISYVYDRNKNKKYPAGNLWDVMEFKTPSINGISYVTINGAKIPVPDNAEEYLSFVYGKDWRIPNPNWHTGDGPATKRLVGEYAEAIFY